MQLNASKCKELVISFGKYEEEFPHLKITLSQIERVNHNRILGKTIPKDLKLNQHKRILPRNFTNVTILLFSLNVLTPLKLMK